jgi:hypothetical protein
MGLIAGANTMCWHFHILTSVAYAEPACLVIAMIDPPIIELSDKGAEL